MPYKIEIFDRAYNFVSFSPVERPEIYVDFLTLEKSSVTCVSISAQKGDFAVITDSKGKTIYSGIVDDVDISEIGTALTLQPLVSIFDCDVYFDRTQSSQIEPFIAGIILRYFRDSSDAAQNITGITVETTSETTGALNLKDNIHNLYEIMTTALSDYGIAVSVEIDAGAKTFAVTIGTIQGAATIESDLPAVVEKSIIIGDSYGETNKFTAVNEDQETETATYYLQPNGQISQNPTERLLPVFFSFGFVSVSSEETFADAAYDAAYSALAKNKYNNLIEVTAAEDNHIFPTATIGRPVTVLDGGNAYSTIITGYSIREKTVTIIMGCVRADLTKKLLMERRRRN